MARPVLIQDGALRPQSTKGRPPSLEIPQILDRVVVGFDRPAGLENTPKIHQGRGSSTTIVSRAQKTTSPVTDPQCPDTAEVIDGAEVIQFRQRPKGRVITTFPCVGPGYDAATPGIRLGVPEGQEKLESRSDGAFRI